MKIDTLLDKIQQFPVIPVFYNNSVEITLDVISVCYEGGMRVFEFTNRGQESTFVFKALIEKRKQFPEMSIGIGTVMDEAQATEFIDLGADFVVSPILDQHVAVVCQQTNKPWVPGCGTLTEVINAQRLGAELIKIFPGNVLGSGFVKSVLGPCPHLKLMPTGGVKPTQENLNEWFKAGVFSVGMGSSLFNKEIVQPQNHQVLKAKILHIKKIVNNAQC